MNLENRKRHTDLENEFRVCRGAGIAKDSGKILCTAIFKMDNQEKPVCIARGTQVNAMCQPGWKGCLGEKGCVCMFT